jgi:RimJ/RimL family protein N-acetyltransferase
VLAVDASHRREGYGIDLKREVVRRAKADGIQAVASAVSPRNQPMRKLNAKLGAIEVPAWRACGLDPDYLWCVIAV